MNPKHILLIVVCILLAMTPLACGQSSTTTTAPTHALPTKTPRPPRPSLTPNIPAVQPTKPQAQPTGTSPAKPTQRPTSDPGTTLFERDYGGTGLRVNDAFIAKYGKAIVVQVDESNKMQYQVINLEDGWEATFTNPLEYMLDSRALSVTSDQILFADYATTEPAFTLWKATPGSEEAVQVKKIENPDAGVICLAFSPDGKNLAVGYASGEIRIFRTSDGEFQRTIKAQNGWVMSLSYSWDGRYLLSDGESFDSNTYVFNASSGSKVTTLVKESWNPEPPAFSPDGSLVAGVNDSGTYIFKTNNWQQTGAMLSVFGGTFACDGSAFLTTNLGGTEVYSLETGELLRTRDYGPIYCLPDGRTVVVDFDSEVVTVRIVTP